MEKSKLIVFIIALIVAVGSLLYWVVNESNKQKATRVAQVDKSYRIGRGIITELHSYKGHSLNIIYSVENKAYVYSGGWDENPKGLDVGDSISFKYSLSDPNKIVTELDSEYGHP